MPFVAFCLVCDGHVPVANGSLLFDQVLEVGQVGEVVFGCLDGGRVIFGGDMEVRVSVCCEGCSLIRGAFSSFQADCPA